MVASCAGEKSHTAKFSDMVAERLGTIADSCGETMEYERITGADLKLNYCRSCENCFKNGICPLDKEDDMAEIKQKMLSADIIFFCSPVYCGSMSALMKGVLDRLSYWMHRLELAGKTAAVLVTASSNHGPQTAEGIAEAVRFLGASVAYSGCVYRHKGVWGPCMYLQPEMEPLLNDICSRVMDSLKTPEKYITSGQELGFQTLNRTSRHARKLADLIGEEPKNEVLVWEQRSLDRCKTLREYVAGMREKREMI